MIALATCSVCAGPYASVSDDPSPAHPSCAPRDVSRYEAATSGPRTYRGSMAAVLAMGCVCGATVPAGGQVTLRDTAEGSRWVCQSCSSAPQSGLTSTESVAGPVPRPRTSPERSGATQGAETTSPRRAAA